MSGCEACATAARESWWGKSIPAGFTHCSECHATFPGSDRYGHCAACHQTFSGRSSFDLHQRVTEDGGLTADCMCSVIQSSNGEESLHGEPHVRKWTVGASTLVYKTAEWGGYWGQPRPEAFA